MKVHDYQDGMRVRRTGVNVGQGDLVGAAGDLGSVRRIARGAVDYVEVDWDDHGHYSPERGWLMESDEIEPAGMAFLREHGFEPGQRVVKLGNHYPSMVASWTEGAVASEAKQVHPHYVGIDWDGVEPIIDDAWWARPEELGRVVADPIWEVGQRVRAATNGGYDEIRPGDAGEVVATLGCDEERGALYHVRFDGAGLHPMWADEIDPLWEDETDDAVAVEVAEDVLHLLGKALNTSGSLDGFLAHHAQQDDLAKLLLGVLRDA